MHIDTLTLMIPGSFTWLLAGTFMLGAWLRNRSAPALLWWAGASFADGIGVALLFAGIALPMPALTMAGVGFVSLAPGLIWAAIRRFNQRSASPLVVVTGVATWLAIGALAHLAGLDAQKWGSAVSFAIWYVYLPAAIYEMWLGRKERLDSFWPLLGLLALHTLVYVGGSWDLMTGVLRLDQSPALFSWFGAIHFESILFAMVGSGLLLLLCKQRVERRYIEAAGVDPLTGIANRRALLAGAERQFERCRIAGAPLSVVMFDLDHFKLVNDTHGHQVGDRVLQGFANTVRAMLRPGDLFGRYGGEEFVLVMPNVSLEAACAIAERARHQFARDYRFIDGRPLAATFSAGVAESTPELTLERLIFVADGAMYAAKHGGRNRVERAASDAGDAGARVVRLA